MPSKMAAPPSTARWDRRPPAAGVSSPSRRPLTPPPGSQTAYLAGVLRQLKDRSGLSLPSLAAKTPYSRSSWDRFLRGQKLPPREAVEMLGRLAAEPVDTLMALWEQAEEQASGRTAGATAPAETPKSPGRQAHSAGPPSVCAPVFPPVSSRRLRRGVIVAAVVCTVAWTCVQAFGPRTHSARSGRTGPFDPLPLTVGCRGASCQGREAAAMACGVDAASYADLKIGLTHVELGVSRNCAAAWARISYSFVGDRVTVQDPPALVERATVLDPASTSRYVLTPMLPARQATQMRACWQPLTGGRHCTRWGTVTP